MNYKPQCDSCKHFITTDKTHKEIKSHIKDRWSWMNEKSGMCKLGYCVKEKKQVYRKNMR